MPLIKCAKDYSFKFSKRFKISITLNGCYFLQFCAILSLADIMSLRNALLQINHKELKAWQYVNPLNKMFHFQQQLQKPETMRERERFVQEKLRSSKSFGMLALKSTPKNRNLYGADNNGTTQYMEQKDNSAASLPDKLEANPLTAVMVIGSIFLFMTLSITGAVLVFCRKKNTVFALQKAEQESECIDYELDDLNNTDIEFADPDELVSETNRTSSIERKSLTCPNIREQMSGFYIDLQQPGTNNDYYYNKGSDGDVETGESDLDEYQSTNDVSNQSLLRRSKSCDLEQVTQKQKAGYQKMVIAAVVERRSRHKDKYYDRVTLCHHSNSEKNSNNEQIDSYYDKSNDNNDSGTRYKSDVLDSASAACESERNGNNRQKTNNRIIHSNTADNMIYSNHRNQNNMPVTIETSAISHHGTNDTAENDAIWNPRQGTLLINNPDIPSSLTSASHFHNGADQLSQLPTATDNSNGIRSQALPVSLSYDALTSYSKANTSSTQRHDDIHDAMQKTIPGNINRTDLYKNTSSYDMYEGQNVNISSMEQIGLQDDAVQEYRSSKPNTPDLRDDSFVSNHRRLTTYSDDHESKLNGTMVTKPDNNAAVVNIDSSKSLAAKSTADSEAANNVAQTSTTSLPFFTPGTQPWKTQQYWSITTPGNWRHSMHDENSSNSHRRKDRRRTNSSQNDPDSKRSGHDKASPASECLDEIVCLDEDEQLASEEQEDDVEESNALLS